MFLLSGVVLTVVITESISVRKQVDEKLMKKPTATKVELDLCAGGYNTRLVIRGW